MTAVTGIGDARLAGGVWMADPVSIGRIPRYSCIRHALRTTPATKTCPRGPRDWDERKNIENQRKHDGISFELATLVFDDENRLIMLNRVDEIGEQRWLAIGAVSSQPGKQAVLIVAHVYRYSTDEIASHGSPGGD